VLVGAREREEPAPHNERIWAGNWFVVICGGVAACGEADSSPTEACEHQLRWLRSVANFATFDVARAVLQRLPWPSSRKHCARTCIDDLHADCDHEDGGADRAGVS
jgi:hypothetical protein